MQALSINQKALNYDYHTVEAKRQSRIDHDLEDDSILDDIVSATAAIKTYLGDGAYNNNEPADGYREDVKTGVQDSSSHILSDTEPVIIQTVLMLSLVMVICLIASPRYCSRIANWLCHEDA